METSAHHETLAMMAAYLRQAELSLHRSNSIAELAEFFKARSMDPWAMLDCCRRFFRAAEKVEVVDWDGVSKSCYSPARIVKVKLARAFGRDAASS